MAQNYTVNYNINVKSKAAVNALTAMESSVAALTRAPEQLQAVADKINGLSKTFSKLSKTYKLGFETKDANTKLDRIIRKLRTINDLAAKSRTITIREGKGSSRSGSSSSSSGKGGGATGVVATGGSKGGSTKPSTKPTTRPTARPARSGNYGYKVLGPSMIDSGGIGAVDMLKGMGVMYGITGLGTLMGNVIRDATNYDNTMATTKNILSVHDSRPDFAGRFSGMERIIRNVGMETKYTAPEVADASRFLAMAGLKLEDINQAIRPIADIALIGDTDLGGTADMMTNIMKGFEIPSANMRNAADVMTSTFTSSNTTLTDLAESYKYAGAILTNAGVNFETASGAMGVLGNAGRQGSMAGTDLRMIMQNIMNPTKKQRAAWKEVGVNTYDKNGKLRNLVDIFGDLHDKNVSADQIMRMFRTTAAPGAMVLTRNVDDWREIIKRNYESQGISQLLADEKKNTIQGLWAQITSAFTEDGMQAFEGLQGQIRYFLNDILSWLKTDDAKNYIAELGSGIMTLMKVFKEFTMTLIENFHRFGPLIKMWLEFQLKLSAVLIPLRIFRSLFHFAGLIQTNIAWIGRATSAFATFFATMSNGSGAIASYRAAMATLAGTPIAPAAAGAVGGTGGATTAPLTGKGRFWGVGGGLVGGLAGGMIGNGLSQAMGAESGSGWNIAATVGGSLLGSAGVMSGMFGALASVPIVGWAAAGAAALGFLGYNMWKTSNASSAAAEEMRKLTNTMQFENGIYSGEGATTVEKHLALVYNKSLSIQETYERRVQLLKEELGLMDSKNKGDAYKVVDNKVMLSTAEALHNADSWFNSNKMGAEAAARVNIKGAPGRALFDVYGNRQVYGWQDVNGNKIKGVNWSDADAFAAMSALYEEGYRGSEHQKAIAEYQNRLRAILMTGGSYDDILQIKKSWWSQYGSFKYDRDTYPSNFKYSPSDLLDPEKWNQEKTYNSYTYKQGLYDSMAGLYGANAPLWATAKTYHNALKNNSLTEDQVVDYISMLDASVGATLAKYSQATVADWMESMGIKDGKFVGKDGLTADEVAKKAQEQISAVITVLNALPQPAQDATSYLSTFINYINQLAGGQVWAGGNAGLAGVGTGMKDGSFQTIGDQKYKKINGEWWGVDKNGDIYGSWQPIGDVDFANMKNGANSTGQNFGGAKNTAGTSGQDGSVGGNLGADSSDYKNHYRSQNAAPKQVIVRIGNLMNVQSIDMSKKDNSEVINDFKSQMAQALIDVVHDFDESYYG